MVSISRMDIGQNVHRSNGLELHMEIMENLNIGTPPGIALVSRCKALRWESPHIDAYSCPWCHKPKHRILLAHGTSSSMSWSCLGHLLQSCLRCVRVCRQHSSTTPRQGYPSQVEDMRKTGAMLRRPARRFYLLGTFSQCF